MQPPLPAAPRCVPAELVASVAGQLVDRAVIPSQWFTVFTDDGEFALRLRETPVGRLGRVIEQLCAGGLATSEFLELVVDDWRDVVDEHGAEVPFSREGVERLAALPLMSESLVAAVANAIAQLRRHGSIAWPVI